MVTAFPKGSVIQSSASAGCFTVQPAASENSQVAGHHSTSPAGPRMAHADGQMLSLPGHSLGSLLKSRQGPISAMRTNGRMPNSGRSEGRPPSSRATATKKLRKRRFPPTKMQVTQHHFCSKSNFIQNPSVFHQQSPSRTFLEYTDGESL